MTRTIGAVALLAVGVSGYAAPAREYPVHAVPHGDVELTDGFWKARLEVNRTSSIPHIHQQNEGGSRPRRTR